MFRRDVSNLIEMLAFWDISGVFQFCYSNYGQGANKMPELFYTSSKYYFNYNTVDITNKTVLRDAINEWMNTSSRTTAEGRYGGHIGTWDVTNVTDMSGLIGSTDYTTSFNEDISGWDTSKVTNMKEMFDDANFQSILTAGIQVKCPI